MGVVDRVAIELVAIVMDDTTEGVITFRYSSKRYCVKIARQEVRYRVTRLTRAPNHAPQQNFVLEAFATFC